MDAAWTGLAEAIQQLRAELDAATAEGDGKRLRFELGQIELEFDVELKRTGSVDGGLRWGIVSAGAKGELAHGSGQRIKLVLQPTDTTTGRAAEVASCWTDPELG
ncbi:trypco2 family protein [Kitasatospora sp. NPDC006786]|uniref:trypco2 family protein n=1 Tax=unclassified Kitasatospora TaxID=2633591 RepID=UPI00340EC7B6